MIHTFFKRLINSIISSLLIYFFVICVIYLLLNTIYTSLISIELCFEIIFTFVVRKFLVRDLYNDRNLLPEVTVTFFMPIFSLYFFVRHAVNLTSLSLFSLLPLVSFLGLTPLMQNILTHPLGGCQHRQDD